MVKKLEGAGLRGQVAGETSLSTVGQIEGLAYRGHKIETLAEKATFEEVAYLLLYNKLPNSSELSDYKSLLKSQRDLPQALKEVLQKNTCECPSYGCYENRNFNVGKSRT
jgi:2-methylcitrate synthase